jgi:outer membrane protein TolC
LSGLLSAGVAAQGPSRPPLSLEEAEKLALVNDPVTMQLQAQGASFSERAVSEGQLPDPQLKLGMVEVPLSNFALNASDFTEVQVGLSQSFPRGRTLKYKGEQATAMATAEDARAENRRREVRRDLRSAYLEILYQLNAQRILTENRALFAQLLDITERQYAAGRDIQQDVLRAQLELSLLEGRLTEIAASEAMARAELAKWVTPTEAERPLPSEFPKLPDIPNLDKVLAALPAHPLMRVEGALVEAALKSVAIAREQYKPGWMLDFLYARRTAENLVQDTGPDFLGAMVTVDLPIFREKRQDRALAASQQEHNAAQYSRADRLRELTQLAKGEFASYQQLGKRLELYRTRALIEAKQTADASLNAYQAGVTDFTTLVRARMTVLDTQLGLVRVQTDRAKAQAGLLYLSGERP